MSLLDPSSFEQRNDGWYASGGYMNTPSSISDKPMLDKQDIIKEGRSSNFSVKSEDLIYVSDWKSGQANPNLARRNPSENINWDLFGLNKGDLFGLENNTPTESNTKSQDHIARAEGDFLREGGDGSGPDMGGPTSTAKGDMTGIDGNFGVNQARGSYDTSRAHEAAKAEAARQGITGAISGSQMGLPGAVTGGLVGTTLGYGQGFAVDMGKQAIENSRAARAANTYSGLLDKSGFSDADIDTNPHGSHTNTGNFDLDSGSQGMDYGGPVDTSPHGSHTDNQEADMGGGGGGGASDSGEGEGHGGGSSSDNDGGGGGGSAGSGGSGSGGSSSDGGESGGEDGGNSDGNSW